MVNSLDFGKRIQIVMEYYTLSASGFADAMGVGRSSISHILSGRNKPSLDFVMKITEAYPEVDLIWLVYGTGVFPKNKDMEIKSKESPKPEIKEILPLQDIPEKLDVAQDLFSQSELIETNMTKKDVEVTNPQPTLRAVDNKEISQIVIFYKDGSFDAYKN